MTPCVAFASRFLDGRAAGIVEPQQTRDFVEGLARSVIARLTQQPLVPPIPDMQQERVSARHQ